MPDSPANLLGAPGAPLNLQTLLSLGALSLVPAILLMTTSFVRITVVLGFLRQALGANNLPSNQVVTALSLFLTILVMRPVWQDVYHEAVQPYTQTNARANAAVDADGSVDADAPATSVTPMSLEDAWSAGSKPIRRFMARQIDMANNSDDVWMFYEYSRRSQGESPPSSYDEVPLEVLAPAFLISELKVAFLIGFQIYLPLLVVDLLVASISTSLGMVMLPPAMVSLPLKVLLFVLADGWRLVVGMLLESFAPYG